MLSRTWAERNRAEWDSLRRLVTPLPQGAFLFSRGFKSGVPSASPSLALSLPPSALRRRRPRHRTPHFSCDSDPRVGIDDFPLGQSRGKERRASLGRKNCRRMNQWKTRFPVSPDRPTATRASFSTFQRERNKTFSVFLQIFREHTLEGSSLALLSESHLTGILGLKLGPAMRLLKAIRAL